MALVIFSALGATANDSTRMRGAVSLFLVVAMVLLLLVIVAVLLVRASRRRRLSVVRSNSATLPDPWSEAARRVQPYKADKSEQ